MGTLFGFDKVTDEEITDLVLMSRQSYQSIPGELTSDDGSVEWENITDQIGLDPAFLGPEGASYIPVSNVLGEGGEAIVYRNIETNTIAVAFQGTGDLADVITSYISAATIPEFSVIPLYSDLILALDLYLLANSEIDRLLLTGHSIGGTLAQGVKSTFSEGRPNLSEISAVTFANPSLAASVGNDILHIGIEGDPIYGLADALIPDVVDIEFPLEPIETTGLQVDVWPTVPDFLGGVALIEKHDPQVYVEVVEVLSTSIFANSETQDAFIDTLPTQIWIATF